MSDDTGVSVLARMDEAKISRLHWKIMFISGMGFFTDAYDLFIIGVFLFPILMSWHGLLSVELAAAIVSVLGLIVSLGMLPETKGRSLEELSATDTQLSPARG